MKVNIGGGFFGLMFLILMTLKLTGFINWSWWMVTAPLWGPTCLVLGVLFVVLAVALIVEFRK